MDLQERYNKDLGGVLQARAEAKRWEWERDWKTDTESGNALGMEGSDIEKGRRRP